MNSAETTHTFVFGVKGLILPVGKVVPKLGKIRFMIRVFFHRGLQNAKISRWNLCGVPDFSTGNKPHYWKVHRICSASLKLSKHTWISLRLSGTPWINISKKNTETYDFFLQKKSRNSQIFCNTHKSYVLHKLWTVW